MAFHALALPSFSAVTTEILPSVVNSLAMPWRGTNSIFQRSNNPSKVEPTKLTSSHAQEVIPMPKQAMTPQFIRHAKLVPVLSSMRAQSILPSPLDIRGSIASMPRHAILAANPILGRPLLRSPHTISSRPMSNLRFERPMRQVLSAGRIVQQRNFGTNGISRSVLAGLETAANRNPGSASAQAGFYQILLRANMPAIVVERYQSGRYATNEVADEAYARALSMMASTTTGASEFATATPSNTTGLGSGGVLNAAQRQAVDQAIAARGGGGNSVVPKVSLEQDGPVNVMIVEPFSTVFFRWFRFVIVFTFVVYLSLIVMSMLAEGMNVFKRPGSKATDSEVRAEKQTTRFSDVHGCDEAKDELQEMVDFLKNPEKFSNLGGKLPKGVLLVGPPGTGKTLLARAVAGEAGVPFFYMSGSEFDEIYVGVGAKRVRELFSAAKAKSPAIVFIDELDAIGGKRNARDAAYVKQTLNQLLTELDGFEQNSGVIIIAATNFPQLLDKALTRPGRFDRHVEVPLPDVRGRIAILKHHAKKIKAAGDVNLDSVAARTAGLSGAELENIVNQAAVRASRLKALSVNREHFEWAMDKVIMGAEKKTMVISEQEMEMTAYHEAGHALVMYFSENGPKKLYKVTVLPRGPTLGHTAFLPEMDKYSLTMTDLILELEVSMGGKAAEEIVYGPTKVTTGVSADIDAATRKAFRMVAQFGMSQLAGPMDYSRRYEALSTDTKAQVEGEVRRLLNEGYDSAMKLLRSRRKELDLLARALVEYETLDTAEVEKVIRGEKLTDRTPMPRRGPIKVPKPIQEAPPVLQPPMEGSTGTPEEPPPAAAA